MFGIPPVRTGGMVRYAADLMVQQMQMGADVSLLIPGRISLFGDCGQKTKVFKRRKDFRKIPTYMIFHPLPIPMCNGILDIKAYTKSCNQEAFRLFLQELCPDIIHIHTFMGLHREFLTQARSMGIPIVFTTHDYFGICPAAVMLFQGNLCEDKQWEKCGECSKAAFGKSRWCLEQSGIYRIFRKHHWMVMLAKKAVRLFTLLAGQEKGRSGAFWQPDYTLLQEYYMSMFRMVSAFHYNSSVAKKIYESRLGRRKGSVILISHAGIADNRRRYHYGKILRIGYFGSWVSYKGFFDLLKVCSRLYEEGCTDLELHLYSDTASRKEKFVRNHPYFTTEQMDSIIRSIDVLAVPGRWPETFGLAALEAVSYGVPVIVSEHTGAKDILEGAALGGFVYDGSRQGLQRVLKEIYWHRELLVQANSDIVHMDHKFDYPSHVQEILNMYQQLILINNRRK